MLVAVVVLAGGSVLAQATPQQPPPPSPELLAQTRIPLLAGTVSDPSGTPIAGAAVNWLNLESNLEGGTMTGPTGRYERRGHLGGSVVTGYQLSGAGPNRLEVYAGGFRSWASPVVVLTAGETMQLDIVLQPDTGAVTPLAPETIRTLAVASAAEAIRLGKKVIENPGIDLVGDLIFMPDHRALHTRSYTRTASQSPPDAFVLATVGAGGSFRESAVVVFRGHQGATFFSYDGTRGLLPLGKTEWREVSTALEDFYRAAANVAQGPERFYPFWSVV